VKRWENRDKKPSDAFLSRTRKKIHNTFIKPVEDAQQIAKYRPTYKGVDKKVVTAVYGEKS
jgi:hypothetical protein